MKIKTKTLATFLKKVTMDGVQTIPEAILRFEEDGLKIDANSQPQQARVTAWLKKSAFKDYDEKFGSVGLSDLQNVRRVLERFGEYLLIKKEGNLLSISGAGKKVDIELTAENFLSSGTGSPNLKFVDTFIIQGSKLSDIFSDVLLNKDSSITVETKEKYVIFSNTGKYKFYNRVEALTCKGGVKSKFGQPLIEATKNLDGKELEISLAQDYPMKVMEKTEDSIITVIVAPRVDDE